MRIADVTSDWLSNAESHRALSWDLRFTINVNDLFAVQDHRKSACYVDDFNYVSTFLHFLLRSLVSTSPVFNLTNS